jgi:hypothetical protein
MLLRLLPRWRTIYNDPTPGGTSQNPDISPSQHIIPACARSNTPPDTHFFYKWGSPVTYHLHGSSKKDTNKLSSVAAKGFLIGYNGPKIYRIWDPERDVILTTSDVQFDEHFNNLKTVSKDEANVDVTAKNKPIPTTAANAVNPSSRITAATTIDNDLLALSTTFNDEAEDSPSALWLRPAAHWQQFALATVTEPSLPRSFKQAVTGPKKEHWIAATRAEIEEMKRKETYRLILKSDLPNEQRSCRENGFLSRK